jgi:hypothetical protein
MFWIHIELYNFKIIYLAPLTAKGCKFEACKSGGRHEKHAVATWNLRNIYLSFRLKAEGNQKPYGDVADRRTFRVHADL